jgi:ABC-2 type transport system ATP-binding protein
VIEYQEATRTYGAHVAVDRLTLAVPAGELFALLGPNGAGKTTAIKLLVGLLQPTRGSVRVCGIDVVAEPREAHAHLGYVPDEVYLYDKLSGREFLHFVADLHGLPESQAAERVDRRSKEFELAGFLDDLAETYSHGMKQRLAFAAALLHEPRVLVLDEPMVGLDPRSARSTKDLLGRLAADGTTVFLSTHTLSVAEEIADRIGIVDRGRLRCSGSLEQLRRDLALEGTTLEELFLEVTGGTASNARSTSSGAD